MEASTPAALSLSRRNAMKAGTPLPEGGVAVRRRSALRIEEHG